jgi:hypothetical protein
VYEKSCWESVVDNAQNGQEKEFPLVSFSAS